MRRIVVSVLFLSALGALSPAQACLRAGCDFESGGAFAASGSAASGPGFGGSGALAIASRYMGTNPTGRRHLWCGHFMNMVERKAGRPGTGSGLARSFVGYGRRVSDPRPGDIAVLRRGGGGHVGYVLGMEGGKVRLLSGNHGGKVGVGKYPRSRVIAFVRP